MREGCLIGCLGLIAVTMILAIIVVVALDGFFGLFREADRISLTEYYGQDHALMALVEPDFDLIGSSVAESTDAEPWMIDYVLPYELTLFADVDRETNTNAYTLAASMKRMAGFMSYYLPRGEGLKLFGDAIITDLGVNNSGVVFIEASAPISEDTLTRAAPMAGIIETAPYTIEGGHLCQIALNNSAGNAFVALEELFEGDSDRPEAERLITPEEELILGQSIGTAQLTFDTVSTDTVSLAVRARLTDPAAAPIIIPLLDEAIRDIARSDEHSTTEVEGEFTGEGSELTGAYTLKHVRHQIGSNWKDALDDFDTKLEEHFKEND